MSVHKDLTGADLHEPKGADTATSGKVYVSDGAGSGVWTTASSIITNTAFTTGDLKITHKATADTSWIMWEDGTIGDGSSSASLRANADTEDLFTLYWVKYSNTYCPVYTSAGVVSTRGASAAADYAAHKRIAVPVGAGRVLGIAGAGSGLTSRNVGSTVGSETHTLTLSEIPTGITSVNAAQNIGVVSTVSGIPRNAVAFNAQRTDGAATGIVGPGGGATAMDVNSVSSTGSNSISVTSNNTSGAAHDIMQPTAFVNVMIKL